MEARNHHQELGSIGPAAPPLAGSPPDPPNVAGTIPRLSAASPPDQPSQVVRRLRYQSRGGSGSPTDPPARERIRRSLMIRGSFPLSDEAIDDAVIRTSPGNYALGYMVDGMFHVFFVGRSDSDVRQRLHEWVGMPSRCERYASQAKASWRVHRRGGFPVNAPALGTVANAETSYTRFAYSYAPSAEAAFERECDDYEDFGGSGMLDNEAPPTRINPG